MSEPQPVSQPQGGAELSSIFATRHKLIEANAAGTALVCGAAVAIIMASFGLYPDNWRYLTIAVGLVIAGLTYLICSPDSMVTRCLLAARKEFIDDRITGIECEEKRRRCLRKSLRY